MSRRAVICVNAGVASKRKDSGSRDRYLESKAAEIVAHLAETTISSGGVAAMARQQGHAKQLAKPSSSR